MTETTAGGGDGAGIWSSRLVRLAARALPAGAVRNRYRSEFLAELHGMTPREQAGHAISVLSHVWSLRLAVTSQELAGADELVSLHVESRPLLCRLNLRHVWAWHSTDDGERYRRCVRCDKDDSRTQGPMDQNGFGIGVSDIMGG